MQKGQCLCGAVAFTVNAPLAGSLACHCKQCRRQTGHFFAAALAPKSAVAFSRDEGLSWYRASDKASRVFCARCGATLFWRPDDGDMIAVGLGALEEPTGLRLGRHVWVNAKGDYYDIADGLPQQEGFEG